MLRRVLTVAAAGLLLLAGASLDGLCARGLAQQKKIPREPVQFVDASTGRPVPELLLIPRYSSFKGVSTMLGEGPGRGTERDYLAKPFVYRAGAPFILKRPKSRGLLLGPFAFIGKGRSVWGVLVFAHGYRPRWFVNLWSEGAERKLQLTPISGDEEARRLREVFGPLEHGATHIRDDCGFWQLAAPCALEIHFDDKERELVRSFLRRGEGGAK